MNRGLRVPQKIKFKIEKLSPILKTIDNYPDS
jgi:hypothetical protein